MSTDSPGTSVRKRSTLRCTAILAYYEWHLHRFTSQLIVWITVSGVIKSFALPWFTQLRRGASIFSLCLCCSSDLPKHLPGLSCGNHIWPLPRSVRKGPSLLFQTCIKLISVGVWENENGRAVYNFSGVLIWALLLILFYKKMTSQR